MLHGPLNPRSTTEGFATMFSTTCKGCSAAQVAGYTTCKPCGDAVEASILPPVVKRNKMHRERACAFRTTYAFASARCMTCDEEVCWSSETDDKAACKATLGHVIAVEVGGKTNATNCGVQCWACNWTANIKGMTDLTNDIVSGALLAWMPSKDALAVVDVRTRAPRTGLATWAERKAARAARGLKW